jgi:putative FmdB family regulatory protein
MPNYDFECEPCCYHAEIFMTFQEYKSVLQCPVCEQNSLKRVILGAPNVFIKGEPTTIGQAADRNTKNMGTYEKQDAERKDRKKTKLTAEQKTKRDLHHRIVSMTPEQQIKWIEKGD